MNLMTSKECLIFMKTGIHGNKETTRRMIAFIPLLVRSITQENTFDMMRIKFATIPSKDINKSHASKKMRL